MTSIFMIPGGTQRAAKFQAEQALRMAKEQKRADFLSAQKNAFAQARTPEAKAAAKAAYLRNVERRREANRQMAAQAKRK
jgi:hypothetical protein